LWWSTIALSGILTGHPSGLLGQWKEVVIKIFCTFWFCVSVSGLKHMVHKVIHGEQLPQKECPETHMTTGGVKVSSQTGQTILLRRS
jgi:hypothetical protein